MLLQNEVESPESTPPMRDRLPTIPCDLSEIARVLTGIPEAIETLVPRSSLFVDVWPCDVPRVTGRIMDHAAHIDHREAYVLSLINGEADVAAILSAVDMPNGEMMGILESLSERGIVRIDPARRAA